MFVLLRHPSAALYHLDFGTPVDPPCSPRELLEWILDDYPARAESLWDLPPGVGQREVVALLPGTEDQRKVDALDCMRIYAVPAPAVKVALACLDADDRKVRIAALRALGSLARFDTAPRLETYLTSPDADERRTAARALAKLGTPEAIAALERATKTDPTLSTELAFAFDWKTAQDTGRVSDLVVPALKTPDFEELCVYSPYCYPELIAVFALATAPVLFRIRAGRVLGLTRQRHALDAALDVVRAPAPDPELYLTAVWMLGRFRDPRALPELSQTVLDTATPDDRRTAVLVESIGRIAKGRSLGVLLNHRDRQTDLVSRSHTDTALMRISRKVEYDSPVWSKGHEPPSIFLVGDDGMLETDGSRLRLIDELRSPSPLRRRDAAFALGITSPGEMARFLVRTLVEEDPVLEVGRIAALACDHAVLRERHELPGPESRHRLPGNNGLS